LETEEREALGRELGEFSKYGRKFNKAIDAVISGAVKESLFLPSGRRVYSVVGRLGDEFIDPQKPYCSCSDFFFKVRGGRDELCYHLLSYKMASKTKRLEITRFSDEEYGPYMRAVVGDVFNNLDIGSK